MKTQRPHVFSALLVAASTAGTPAIADTLAIKIVVMLKEKWPEPARPLADVGGFKLKRGATIIHPLACPDSSNALGELICKVACNGNDADMRVSVVSPTKEEARIVAGYGHPPSVSVDISKCKITSGTPIKMLYKTADVMFAELQASAPAVYNTLVVSPGATPMAGVAVRIKPLSETSEQLKTLAQNPKNRDALLELSRIATMYQQSTNAPDRPTQSNALGPLEQYAVGANAVLLQTDAANTIGSKAKVIVPITDDPSQLNRSVGILEKELAKKPTLTPEEIRLDKTVRGLKQQDFSRTGLAR